MRSIYLHLVDQEPELVEAWEEQFKDSPEVAVVQGDILSITYNTIVSPTMMAPEPVPPSNCFFAMHAVLRAADNYPGITDVFCPGLGTGIGCVPFDLAASEMAIAYRKWKKRPK